MTEYEKINRRFEKLFFGRVNKAIKKKFDELIKIIETSGLKAGEAYLNTQLTNPDLVTEIQRLYTTVGLRHANEATRDLKRQEKGFGFNAEWVAFILDYLKEHLLENVVFGVNTTTRNYLLKVLSRATTEGWGVDKTVRNLNESGFSEMQAARIVRTEINTASNAGVLAAGETYEYQMQKEWVAINDSRTAIPLLTSRQNTFNRKLQTDGGFKGENVYAAYDTECFGELQTDMKEVMDAMSMLTMVTPNEEREACNMELRPEPEADEVWVKQGAGRIPISDYQANAVDEALMRQSIIDGNNDTGKEGNKPNGKTGKERVSYS